MNDLIDTLWEITESDGDVIHVTFLENGYLQFTNIKSKDNQGNIYGGRNSDETWKLENKSITLSFTDGFKLMSGEINSNFDSMEGKYENQQSIKGEWSGKYLTKSKLKSTTSGDLSSTELTEKPKDKMKVNRLRIKGSGTGLEQKLSAELTENIDKIKQLLTLPDYDKIDAGIELAISLEEPKIFEILLNGCSLESSRPKLNEWMKRLIISSGEIINEPTGYYVFLSLIINAPGDAKIHQSFKLDDIKCLNLTKCYLSALPKNFSKLKNLEKLYLEYNNLGPSIPNEIFKLNNLIGLYLGHNVIETIPDEISALKNLQLLAFGFNLVNKLSEKLSQLKSLKHLDISNNNFGPFPDVSQLKSLINLCCFAYDDDAKPFGCTCSDCKLSDNHKCNEECACCSPCDDQVEIAEEIKKRFEISILSEFVIEGVQCNEQLQTCDNWFNSNGGGISRHDGDFCESCDSDWNDIYSHCECCGEYIAPNNYVDIKEWDIYKWYQDKIWESYDDIGEVAGQVDTTPLQNIIIKKDGTLDSKEICYICKENLPKADIPLEIDEDIENSIYDSNSSFSSDIEAINYAIGAILGDAALEHNDAIIFNKYIRIKETISINKTTWSYTTKNDWSD